MILRKWLPRCLPSLKQGSTLTLRSTMVNSNILIRSKWRDDGEFSLTHKASKDTTYPQFVISQKDDAQTSLGRKESHILVQIHEKAGVLEELHPGEVRHDTESEEISVRGDDEIFVTLEVPEKINIDCELAQGGSVAIENKIEGDVRIHTDGDVTIQKIRAYSIDINLAGKANCLYASDLLEARDVTICVPSSGRIRVKRIHADSCNIRMNESSTVKRPSLFRESPLFDTDDAGAICDISSIYMTGDDSTLDIQCSTDETRQAIRVKSNHGHMTAKVSAPFPSIVDVNNNERVPIADIGGVNGSCEVFIDSKGRDFSDAPSCRIHYDSVSPDSVSVVKSNRGSMHMTLDRKIESDIRILSSSQIDYTDVDTILLDREDEEFHDLQKMLDDLDSRSNPYPGGNPIQIHTKAFTANEEGKTWKNIHFVDGWVENRSEEPDSRFDRKLKGKGGSVGKISVDEASNQSLQNFQGHMKSAFVRPIITVLGSNSIAVETLSWLGNIARRYGLDDKREISDIGRTATRRGRSIDSE